MPLKKYQVIYADPPWSYTNKTTGRTNGNQPEGSGAHTKYPTMLLQEIISLPVKQITEKDAVIYLWATVPLMPEAFAVLKAWGFEYKTMLTWRKIMSLGMGYWYRGQCEHLLFGVRGKVKAFRVQKANFIQTKAGKHSEKPQEFRDLINLSTSHLPNKIELFARNTHEGWDVFGNEVDNSINIFSYDLDGL